MSSPFGKKTPESYFSGLRRKDSKNALTTCHGVTSNGRACRRALSSPKNSSKFDGAVVITDNDSDPAVFFCWQHRDQADSARRRTSDSPRVREGKISSHRRSDSGIDTPPSDPLNPRRVSEKGRSTTRKAVPKATRPGLQVYRDSAPEQPTQNTYLQPRVSELQSTTGRPSTLRAKSTPDPQQLNRIHGEWPPPLPRNATDSVRIAYAKLLTAMSEPPTKGDSPGYIYIFWQTDTEQTDDETSAVASIISAPADRGLHRQETILQRRFFQTSANARSFHPVEKRTIFLKIGRAANVHQRLSQWKKQCDYDITLLRIYPYDPDRREAARKVIYVGKVERLIHLHLEMLGQRVSKRCRCGTEHKEWFEVEATTRGIRDVDEIVRKWVQWSEDRFGV
ncbi:DUF1766-domain-containing protein [Tothia fuscella]|uniref:DUF1766-domain-containing protein n=1 Tax=Tothia fuscella TaxID=1048955 RepID=A0A9P4TUE0_9PEZI|nr:DUF1766-domain-containing protein [Tothia fuscella]